MIRDITAIKKAEEAERENARRLQRLIDSNILGIIVAELEGKIVEANDAFLNMVGYAHDELISGKIDWPRMTPPEYQHLEQKALEELFATGCCPAFAKEYIRKDGSRVPILIGGVLWDTSTDNPTWVCFVLDITELKSLQEALRQSKADYRTLIESAPDGVMSLDSEGYVIDCNDTLCDLMGYTKKEEVQGKHISEFIANLSQEQVDDYYAQLTQTKQFDVEFRVVAGDDRMVQMWAKAVALSSPSGDLSRVIVYVRDITERKRLEELKDEFIGLVSHELRTPLTVIMGSLNTVLSEFARLSSKEIEQLLRDAALEAESLSHLLGNLLELSRVQAKQLSLHTEPVSVDVIVRNTVEKIERQSTSHQFLLDLPGNLPLVNADPLRLERILYNLLDNAAKYSPHGSDVRVFSRPEEEYLVIGVADQGAGISLHDQAKLFGAFQRLECSGVQGAGLGLLVCRRLVEAHGGRIWVKSKRGQGSTFYFALPLEPTALS